MFCEGLVMCGRLVMCSVWGYSDMFCEGLVMCSLSG